MGDTHSTERGRTVSVPLPSASVILLRRATVGFETFMVRRATQAASFADAYVFPGGVVRHDDYGYQPPEDVFTADQALEELTARGSTPPESAALALALWHAALRELFEEAGVLLARDTSGAMLRILAADATRFAELRQALQAGRLTMGQILADERLTLDYRALRYFSHWITPVYVPRRFDTRFFVAEMPEGQTAIHCQIESTDGIWIRPDDALSRSARGQFSIVFPTRMHLERLSQHASLGEVLTFAARKPIRTVMPTRAGPSDRDPVVLPPEASEW